MKQLDLFKSLLLVALFCGAGLLKAQTIHPLHFGAIGGSTVTNWYQDYVGVRFEVLSPTAVAGDKQYSYAFSGGSSWGGNIAVTGPLINKQIIMPQAGDSLCGSAVTVDMTGKIAFVYRGGGIYFSDKALRCQAAGAIAVVIVNNASNGVIGMSASTSGTTIPVFMITKADGDAIDAKYHSGVAGDTARMTITLWGQNNQYDLGFISEGYSLWHDYAVPYSQLTSGINPKAYKGQNGAFVANFGLGNPGKVTLTSATTFYPSVGAPVLMHNDTVKLTSGFPAIDSIYAMYAPEYNLSGITAGAGRVITKYSLKSDSVDQYLGDDTVSYSFYTTDSLYSKGRYDFVNQRPLASTYLAPALGTAAPNGDFFIWGPFYYVAQGGGNFCKVQWTMSSNTDTVGTISSLAKTQVFVFKWADGVGGTADSFVENGELQLIGSGVKAFSSSNPGDTSGGVFTVTIGDSLGNPAAVHVDSNTWYYVAPELQNGWFLGLDGNNNSFPRSYGRIQFTNYVEYPSAMWPGGQNLNGIGPMTGFPTSALLPWAFGGSFDVDSVRFSQTKGSIPAVPFTTTRFAPDTSHSHVGVNGINQKVQKFELFPNPATSVVNASLEFASNAGDVVYTIIDGSARVVAKVEHKGVMTVDQFTYSTNNLTSGNYYLVVMAGEKQMFKKFTVIR